jgi:hypothetical protein
LQQFTRLNHFDEINTTVSFFKEKYSKELLVDLVTISAGMMVIIKLKMIG